jgi:hypothetical protein
MVVKLDLNFCIYFSVFLQETDVSSDYETIVQCAQRPPNGSSTSHKLHRNVDQENDNSIVDLTVDFTVSYVYFVHS